MIESYFKSRVGNKSFEAEYNSETGSCVLKEKLGKNEYYPWKISNRISFKEKNIGSVIEVLEKLRDEIGGEK